MAEPSEFDLALQELHALMGLSGNNRERQAIARRAMAGREPTLTPQERDAVARRSAISAQNDQAVEQGIGDLVLGQPIRAAGAIGEAFQNASLANVTNAGVQSALSVPTMRGLGAAVGIGSAGLGLAGASDMGLFDGGANAQSVKQDKAAAERAKAEAAKARAETEGKAAILRAEADAAKRAAETEAKRKADELAAQKASADFAEYNAAVSRADLAKNEILADRPKKFKDTAVGELFDKLGVVAPGVVGAGTGAATRGGLRAAGVGNKLGLMAGPIATGILSGAAAANWPLGHELLVQPPENPEKKAYEAYARELPPTHPRKQEWTNYAERLPEANPARKVASEEFYDPVKLAERSAIGAVEGGLGGLMGAEIPAFMYYAGKNTFNALREGGRKSASTMGAADALAQPAVSPGSANALNRVAAAETGPVDYRQYSQLPASVRTSIQDAYLAGRSIGGTPLPPKQTAEAIQQALQQANINVPITARRVNRTNEVLDAFIVANRRLPTKNELAKLFNNSTLAVPAAVGIGAAGNALSQNYGTEDEQPYNAITNYRRQP
jgi:hypothetical protein